LRYEALMNEGLDMKTVQAVTKQRASMLFIILHCCLFIGIALLFLPNMDIDMFENYAWGQTLAWGSFKHPPLFAWVTRLWFSLLPTNDIFYFCLSYVNAGIGLWGVAALARLLVLKGNHSNNLRQEQIKSFLTWVIGFSVLSLPYNFYAAIFNADAVSLSLWPWTTYAFFTSITKVGPRLKGFWAVLLGILSAASVLGKYFSVVLLMTLFIISLSQRDYRLWYKTRYPYISFVVFIVLITPHILWEYSMGFPFKLYYAHYLNLSFDKILKHILTFSFTGIYYFVLSWGLLGVVWWTRRSQKRSHTHYWIDNQALLSLCLLPMILTILLSLLGAVSLMDRWAIPLWFALPILIANLLTGSFDILTLPLKWLYLFYLGFLTFIFLIFGYTFWTSTDYLSQHHDYSEGRQEMAISIAHRFQKHFPEHTLDWVGGEIWPDNTASITYYINNHPRALPGFPNAMPALVNPYHQWSKRYGAILCGKKYADREDVVIDCIKSTRAWLKSESIAVHEEIISYHAKGWRWQHVPAQARTITVFWVMPRGVEGASLF
jgi:hypothetical protein